METKSAEERSFNLGPIIKFLTYVIVLGIGVYGGTVLAQYKPQWFGLSSGTQQAQAEVSALVAKVGKLITLPADETPTVATVTDASKIKDQPFFRNSENGDKVLIYQKASKAILYRESENRIIEVGSLNFNQPASPTPTPTGSGKAKATPKPTESPTPTPTSTPTATP